MMSELTTKIRVPAGQVSYSYNLSFMRYKGEYMSPPLCKMGPKNNPCKIWLSRLSIDSIIVETNNEYVNKPSSSLLYTVSSKNKV